MIPSRGVPARRVLGVSSLLLCIAAGVGHAAVAPETSPTTWAVDRLHHAALAEDRAQPRPDLDTSPAWLDWSRQHPGWRATWNTTTSTPHRASGPGVRLEGYGIVTDSNVEGASREFLRGLEPLTGMHDGDLHLLAADHKLGRWYVIFEQVHDGVPVRDSRVDLRLGPTGEVALFGADVYRDLHVSTHPSLAAGVALLSARAGLPGTATDVHEQLVVVPERTPAGLAYHLAYEQRFRTVDPPGAWLAWVDAQTGELLFRDNQIRWAGPLTGRVTALVESTTVGDPQNARPLRDLRFNVGTGSPEFGYTNPDGNFNVNTAANDTVNLGVFVRLSGKYGRVFGGQVGGPTPRIDAHMHPGTSRDFLFDDSNSKASERDAYHSALVAHQYIKDLDSLFTGVDYTMPITVDITARDCNAFYDGLGINFFGQSSRCPSTSRIADVVYHEYGHGITDHVYRPLAPSGAMHEGFSDYYAATITNQPLIGIGFRGPGTHLRSVQNTNHFPEDINGEVHHDGLIIAGCLWDLRLQVGHAVADTLFHFARYGRADNFDDYMMDVLFTDDDNSNIYDGTPHFDQIVSAFNGHGVGDYSVHILHEPLADTEDLSKVLEVKVQILSIFALQEATLRLHYQGPGDALDTWHALLLVPTGGAAREFAAVIPPQAGSFLYYITAADTAGHETILPPSGPLGPYHFRVGADNQPPQIVHTSIGDQPLDAPDWPVLASVTDNLDHGLRSVTLHYSRNSKALDQTASFAPRQLPDWLAALPAGGAALGDSLYYAIVAQDSALVPNTATNPGAGGYHSLRIVQGFRRDFESNDGGLTGGGDWAHGLPTSGPGAGYWGRVWSTGLTGNYSDNRTSDLTSAPIDLGTWRRAALRFQQWGSTEPFFDGGQVQVSNDGALTWQLLVPDGGYPFDFVAALGGPGYSGESNGWRKAEFDLSRFLGQTIQLRWRFASDQGVTKPGWDVDELEVVETQILAVPLHLAAVDGLDSRVDLRWDAPAGLDPNQAGTPLQGYRVYSGGDPDHLALRGETPATTSRFTDTGLQNGVPYIYWVTAHYAEGDSRRSDPVQGLPFVAGYSADVSALDVTVQDSTAADTTVTFSNTGTGYLTANLWLGDAGDTIDAVRIAYDIQNPAAKSAHPRFTPGPSTGLGLVETLRQIASRPAETKSVRVVPETSKPSGVEYQLLYTDTQEGNITPDLKDLLVREVGGNLEFKVTGYGDWGDITANFNIILTIDADTNRATGDAAGADFYLLVGNFALRTYGSPAVLVTSRQGFVGVPPYQVFGTDNFEVGGPIGFFGGSKRLYLSLVALQPNLQTFIDGAPNGRFIQAWLRPGALHVVAPAGVLTPLTLVFPGAVPPGAYQGKIFLETNAPATPRVEIPVSYHFRETPVELFDFAAAQLEDDVELTWRTSREQHVAAFRVFRERDGGPLEPLRPDVAAGGRGSYTFRDAGVERGSYVYRVAEVSPEGAVALQGGEARIEVARSVPHRSFLDPNEPNPFNPSTTLRFGVSRAGAAELTIFDARGRRVRLLWQKRQAEPGIYRVTWDGRDDRGSRVASGVYHARLEAKGGAWSRRLTLVK